MMGNRFFQRITYGLILAIIMVMNIAPIIKADEQGSDPLVYVIPVENEVERGLEAFISRTTTEATEENADNIIFEIDTPGGRIDAAGTIGKILQNLDISTTSFVVSEALSAGSYIALNTDHIFMTPQARMGASGVINQDGTAADKKAQSAWIAAMESAAESKGRDPLYAKAMADPEIDLPEYGAEKGKYLTLSPSAAVEVAYAEGIVNDQAALLQELGLENATVVEMETTLAEELARFLTNPVVIPILLSVASLGLIVELYSPGFGVPGTMGILALLLFFYGHAIAGFAGMEAIILFVFGIVLIIAEWFVPGGIVGLLGVGAIIGSLFMSGYDLGHMALSIAIALTVTIVVSMILFKMIGLERGLFRHIILKDRTSSELGYVSSENRPEWIGLQGIAATPLRPSGTAIFDGKRFDVISEGGFIDKDKPVEIVKVEGIRIVVREL